MSHLDGWLHKGEWDGTSRVGSGRGKGQLGKASQKDDEGRRAVEDNVTQYKEFQDECCCMMYVWA